jgi:hypothetical protein
VGVTGGLGGETQRHGANDKKELISQSGLLKAEILENGVNFGEFWF